MYKERLIELFKTIPEIKKDLEELKFWCRLKTPRGEIVKFSHTIKHEAGVRTVKDTDGTTFETKTNAWTNYICIKEDGWIYQYWLFGEDKIIWNPIEERHLRIFCEESGYIMIDEYGVILDASDVDYQPEVCELNNKKAFSEQSESFYKKLYLFLKKTIWK